MKLRSEFGRESDCVGTGHGAGKSAPTGGRNPRSLRDLPFVRLLPRRETLLRWVKFDMVGAMGWCLHLTLLAVLVHGLRMHYQWATLLSVEVALLHNFCWHLRWTWARRTALAPRAWPGLLLRFNLTSGAVSLAGNLVSMQIFSGLIGIEPVLSSLLSIVPCGLTNFLLCDRLVFSSQSFPKQFAEPAFTPSRQTSHPLLTSPASTEGGPGDRPTRSLCSLLRLSPVARPLLPAVAPGQPSESGVRKPD